MTRAVGARPRAPFPLLLAGWCALVAAQLGWLPGLRHAWALQLWSYLPQWAAWLLGALSLSLCAPRVRDGLAAALAAAGRRLPAGGAWEAAGVALVALLLWLLRERARSGDSAVLVALAYSDVAYVFPEVGVTFLLRGLARIAPALGVDGAGAMAALSCACGGAAFWLSLRVGRELLPSGGGVALAMLLFSGGLARVFAGRIEVYAPLLAAVLAYLWMGLRALRGSGGSAPAALLLGVAIWLHAAAALLVPSLLAIGALRPQPRAGRAAWRERATCLALAGAPLATFLAIDGLVGGQATLELAGTRVLEILGRSGAPDATRWWVRGWGGAPSIGTDVVWLSAPHLKYLLNSFWLLLPACLPGLLLLLLRRPRSLVAGAEGRWLAVAALPLAAYATAVRPFWGPWDWDLFALVALVLGLLCIRALASLRPAPGLAVACVGFQLCFVGIPFLWIGAGTPRDVGPFGFREFDYDLREPGRAPPERIAPWL